MADNKVKTPLTKRLAYGFVASGAGLLATSYVLSSQVLILMGLGLAFWGALFLLIAPVIHIEGSVVVNTISSTYLTTERIIKQLDCKGKGFHLPPYRKEGYIPEHLKSFSEMVVFIPKDSETVHQPSLQELAEGKVMVENPEGILLTPPGLGLLSSIEKTLRVDFTKAGSDEVCKIMPKAVTGTFSLAKEVKIAEKEGHFHVRISNSVFRGLYLEQNKASSVSTLGCPIVSSIACSLAKCSGKLVAIDKIKSSPDGSVIDAQLHVV